VKVIVHGGAGSNPDEPAPRQATLDEAAAAGAAEADPVDAVEAAIRVLEADARFNAGTGGAVQSDGVIRTDAGVMTSGRNGRSAERGDGEAVSDRAPGDDREESPNDRTGSAATREAGDDREESPDERTGSAATREAGDDREESPNDRTGSTATREAGAVASMPGVEAAVSVARAVMEETPHVLLNGVHAVDFAADVGVDVECDLWSDDTRERWDDLDDHPEGGPLEHRDWIRDKFGQRVAERSEATEGASDVSGRGATGGTEEPRSSGEAASSDPEGRDRKDHDTVGAVASGGGRFATATSTGGRWLALAGRVGDVPQIGSGFYAAPAGAASATGAGEDIAKATLTRRAVRHLENGLDAQAAADRAIEEFEEMTGSSAGVIVLDSGGGYGEAFNSERMQTARDRA